MLGRSTGRDGSQVCTKNSDTLPALATMKSYMTSPCCCQCQDVLLGPREESHWWASLISTSLLGFWHELL